MGFHSSVAERVDAEEPYKLFCESEEIRKPHRIAYMQGSSPCRKNKKAAECMMRDKNDQTSLVVRGAESRLRAHKVSPKAHDTNGLCVNG